MSFTFFFWRLMNCRVNLLIVFVCYFQRAVEEDLVYDGSDDELAAAKAVSRKSSVDNLTATAKLKKQLAAFLDLDDDSDDESDDNVQTTMDCHVEGEDGQFVRDGVVYDLHDVDQEEDADEPPAKRSKTEARAKSKDFEVYQKIKSVLDTLTRQKGAPGGVATSQTEQQAEDEDEDGDEDEESEDDVELRWKDDLARKASDAYYQRQTGKGNLRKLVYGTECALNEAGPEEAEDDDALGGLFKMVSTKRQEDQSVHSAKDLIDCSLFRVDKVRDWSKEDVLDSIRDCFVTGKWKEDEDAEELLDLDDFDEDAEGDFEDLETGQVGRAVAATTAAKKEPTGGGGGDDDHHQELTPEEERRKRWEKKKKLKEQFNSEYDEDGEGKGKSYYDDLKQEMDQQATINKSEFEGMDDELRVQYEGFRPGMYVRMEIEQVPCELVTNFNPAYPIIVGALLAGEENIGFVQVSFAPFNQS